MFATAARNWMIIRTAAKTQKDNRRNNPASTENTSIAKTMNAEWEEAVLNGGRYTRRRWFQMWCLHQTLSNRGRGLHYKYDCKDISRCLPWPKGKQVGVLWFFTVQMDWNHLRKRGICPWHDGKFGKMFSHDSGCNRQELQCIWYERAGPIILNCKPVYVGYPV